MLDYDQSLMVRRKQPPPEMHELEAEVMEGIWRHGRPLTVRELMDDLNARREKARAYTTYMTVMMRLVEKDMLRRKRQGKADVYRPRMDRETYVQRRVAAQVDTLVTAYGDAALAHFARAIEDLDPGRAEELRRIARDG